jgi:hypothetical protein
MEMNYRIDPARGFVLLTASARPTIERWTALMDRVLADPAFQPGYSFVADYRNVVVPPDRAYVDAQVVYAQSKAAIIGPLRWAIIVPSRPQAAHAVTQALDTVAGRPDVTLRAFTDFEAGIRWASQRAAGPE